MTLITFFVEYINMWFRAFYRQLSLNIDIYDYNWHNKYCFLSLIIYKKICPFLKVSS